jgi:hypothetical protein
MHIKQCHESFHTQGIYKRTARRFHSRIRYCNDHLLNIVYLDPQKDIKRIHRQVQPRHYSNDRF